VILDLGRDSGSIRRVGRASMEFELPAGGGSHVVVTWVRTASNLRGRYRLLPRALGGTRLLGWATGRALTNIGAKLGNG
jgi:hypothetical protein